MPIDWPPNQPRTPPQDRIRTHKYKVTRGQAIDDLRTEMDRLNVSGYRASTASGGSYTHSDGMPKSDANPNDPGFYLRWSKDGDQYGVGCDYYVKLTHNIREVGLWVKETRMSGDRHVVTESDQFATAALPPGEDYEEPTVTVGDPFEVLGVRNDAPKAIINAAYRELSKEAHADGGGSTEEMLRLNKAKEMALERSG